MLLVLLRVLHVLLHLLLGNARQHSVLLQLGECTQQCPAAFLPPAHLALLPAVGGAQCSGAQGRASPGVRGAARPLPGAPCCCRLRCPQVCPPSASCRPRRCLPAMRAALLPCCPVPCCPAARNLPLLLLRQPLRSWASAGGFGGPGSCLCICGLTACCRPRIRRSAAGECVCG